MDELNLSASMRDCCHPTSSTSNESVRNTSSRESVNENKQEDFLSKVWFSSALNNNDEELDELSNFRKKWQNELQIKNENDNKSLCANKSTRDENDDDNDNNVDHENSVEGHAKKWFLQGVENEKNGKLYDAILCYKKAVQLVPDIEFKLYEPHKARERTYALDSKAGSIKIQNLNKNDLSEENKDNEELVMKLEQVLSLSKSICEPLNEQKTTHISALPTEIILYIFRWVVSFDLDLRSLEMCSMVCRGFYLCSRDPEIWRVACLKVWGVNCGGLNSFNNWRMMFLRRPHLNYNGCYISKTTYIRHGENSFQDQFYRPWHVVEYFRYLRFFPEGTVLMLTTPDQPVPVLGLLKKREARNSSILSGYYRLLDDKVSIVLHRQDLINNNRYRGRRSNIPIDLAEQAFHIELQVMTLKNGLNNKLLWKKYIVISKRGNTETKANFDITSNRFPPFWFSRVKSYTAVSDRPL